MAFENHASLTTLIAGVGGQGVVLAGGVLAQAALLTGFEVRQSETHGLSQRFGSVSCQVRIGSGVYSPHRGHGGVDLLVALEGYEAFKQLPFLRPGGMALVNRLWRKPIAGKKVVAVNSDLRDPRVEWFEGTEIARLAECPQSLNFFMLGVLSSRAEIREADWYKAIEGATKKGRDANQQMFAAGRQIGTRVSLPDMVGLNASQAGVAARYV